MRQNPVPPLTLDQAYQAAYLWMFHIGEPPVEIAERGSQSVELRSAGVAAFVRVPDHELNQRTVLAVLASEPGDRTRVIFSTTGFTPGAISIAQAQGIALYSLALDGSAVPENGRAVDIAPLDGPPPPFPVGRREEDFAVTKANWGPSEVSHEEWVDCPSCGANQHRSLEFCRICGRALAAPAPAMASGEAIYRCIDCGSRNVEAIVPTVAPDRAERH
jgi:hypothetical protein